MRYSNLSLAGAALALMMTTATGAYAQTKSVGTMAGTDIVNTVNLSFRRGSETVNTTASATFHVDRKIDMIMDTPHDTDIVLDLGLGVFTETMTFNFTNYSNATADFVITVAVPAGFSEAASGDDTYSIMVDGVALANGGTITVAAGAEPVITVTARFDPDTNASRTFEVTAAPTGDFAEATGRDITLAGAANMNTIHLFDAADQVADATVVLSSPLLTATKDVAVISQDATFDCENGAAASGAQAAIPGACIEYTITVNNTGGAAMRDLRIIDTMPSGITLVGASSTFDFDIGINGAEVQARATSNLTAGNTAVLKIRATID